MEKHVHQTFHEEFINAPIHDTGKFIYSLLSFLLPVFGIIAAFVYKHFNYIRNYKACKKGAIAGFVTIGVLILLFLLLLLLVVI